MAAPSFVRVLHWRAPRCRVTVLHVITGLNVGGAETMLAKLLESGGARGDAVVLTLLPPGPVGQRMIAAGVKVETLGMRAGVPSPVAIARLIGAARRLRPRLIQGWMYHGNLAASLAARAFSPHPPVLWNVRHSLADMALEKPMTRAVVRLGARLSRGPSTIVYNSRVAAAQHAALGYADDRALVIPNGFDCERFRPRADAAARLRRLFGVDRAATVVGMIARQHPMKDAATLARAVGLARAAGHDLHLLIVGHGMARPASELALALQALPPERVTLSDARNDVADWLPGLDMLAMPSAWGEGFPNVLGEAMACGVPCVATDVGDSGWVVGASGLVVPPRDAAALAVALGDLAGRGADARRELGIAARARVVECFALDAVAATYAALYHAVPARDLSARRADAPAGSPRQATP